MGVLSILAGLRKTAVCVQKELAEIATACADAAKALDEGKADSVPLHEITIPSEGWEKDNSGNYRLNMDIPGLTDEDTVNVLIDPHELGAKEEDLVETQSSTDTLTLIAKAVPTAALKAYYYKVKGDILVAVGSVVLPGKKYSLPPATANTLGGVMIGDGLSVDKNGKAAFAPAAMTNPTAKALSTKLAGEGLSVDKTGKMNVDQTGALACFPIGSIYQSTDPTSPAALFGGTWEQIASERVLMGASSSHKAGTTVKSGLPNITGTANGGVLSVSTPQSNGAFGATHYDSSLSYLSGDVRRLSTYNRTFDASRSNPIYGASDTVQPAAYYVYIWHRVA
jgi:hypothetical protein